MSGQPCSATGTIRRHPDVAWTKRASDIASLAQAQARLLDRATRLVRPGGRLVYCVCSLEPEEGEEQIEYVLRRRPELRRSPIAPETTSGTAWLGRARRGRAVRCDVEEVKAMDGCACSGGGP